MDRLERTDRNVCHGQNEESGLKLSLKSVCACVCSCCSRPELQLRMRVVGNGDKSVAATHQRQPTDHSSSNGSSTNCEHRKSVTINSIKSVELFPRVTPKNSKLQIRHRNESQTCVEQANKQTNKRTRIE